MLGVVRRGHPHSLTLGGDRLRSTHVREDDVPIEGSLVDVLGGSIKAGSTVHHTLTLAILALLPNINLIFSNLTIKRNHRELCKLGKLIKLGEELGKHLVINRARLVNADCNLGSSVCLCLLYTSDAADE